MEFLKTLSRLPTAFFPTSLRGQSIITCIYRKSRANIETHFWSKWTSQISGIQSCCTCCISSRIMFTSFTSYIHHTSQFPQIIQHHSAMFRRDAGLGTGTLAALYSCETAAGEQHLQPILVDSMGAVGSLEYPNAVYGSWFHKNSMNMSKESQQYALGHGCGKVQSTSCSSLKWTDTHTHTLTHFQTHTHAHTRSHFIHRQFKWHVSVSIDNACFVLFCVFVCNAM